MLACIVEGHGERHALPVLARRVGESLRPAVYWHVPPAIRVPRSKLLRQGELERSVRLARANVVNSADGVGAVLVVIDADDDCAALLGPELHQRAVSVADEVPVGVVLAVAEFEAWFLAAMPSLRGRRGIRPDADSVAAPETIRGAKEALRRQMLPGRTYSSTADQPALVALMDLDAARSADSFDKLWRVLQELGAALPPTAAAARSSRR